MQIKYSLRVTVSKKTKSGDIVQSKDVIDLKILIRKYLVPQKERLSNVPALVVQLIKLIIFLNQILHRLINNSSKLDLYNLTITRKFLNGRDRHIETTSCLSQF